MSPANDPAAERVLRVNQRVRIPLSELRVRVSRSSGPGGQHANKTESRVEVTFDIFESTALGPNQKRRVAAKLGPIARAVSQDERSQARNRELALKRMADRLALALRVEKRRVATKPTPAAREQRLGQKRRRADLKTARRKPSPDE